MDIKRVLILSLVIVVWVVFTVSLKGPKKTTFTQQNHLSADIDTQIGSMIMVGFRGITLDESQHIGRDISKYKVGGVILFDYDVPSKSGRRNILSPIQLENLTSSIQNYTDYTILIGIDQEGGKVSRLKKERGFISTISAEKIGRINDIDSTRKYAEKAAEQLADLGFNINFAPVLDLNTNPENPVIGALERSISAEPEVVKRHAAIILDTFYKHGIIGAGKHFPGHGSSEEDSHLGVVDVTETWQSEELQPYQKLINEEALRAVMTAHIYNAKLDSLWPATLSQKVIAGVLRNQLGFNGVVFSDDLQMEAIRSEYTLEETIYRSLKADVDILLFANNSVYQPDIVPKTVKIIKKLLDEGRIEEERINRSYERIQQLRQQIKN